MRVCLCEVAKLFWQLTILVVFWDRLIKLLPFCLSWCFTWIFFFARNLWWNLWGFENWTSKVSRSSFWIVFGKQVFPDHPVLGVFSQNLQLHWEQKSWQRFQHTKNIYDGGNASQITPFCGSTMFNSTLIHEQLNILCPKTVYTVRI